ncbi:MAG TPA: STAS domain-containing protein [Solirubrobacteraceae bacterium]
MNVTLAEERGVPIAHVAGAVDLTTADDLSATLRSAVPNAAMGLVLDLTATTHLDSAGLRVLFDAIRRLGRRQQELRVVVDPESLVADLVAATDVGSYAGVDFAVGDAVEQLAVAPI